MQNMPIAYWKESLHGEFAEKAKRVAVFCDFDGTISEQDAIVMVMEAFAPPQWREISDEILHTQTISVQEGIQKLYSLLPSRLEPEIQVFLKENVRLRAGFDRFVAFCSQQGIPLNIVSGGLESFITPLVSPYQDKLRIFANRTCLQAETIEVKMPYFPEKCDPCGKCACCKVEIIDQVCQTACGSPWVKIAIGDSVTDFGMAQTADFTYTRDKLTPFCQQNQLPHLPFESFDTIIADLKTKITLKNCSAAEGLLPC